MFTLTLQMDNDHKSRRVFWVRPQGFQKLQIKIDSLKICFYNNSNYISNNKHNFDLLRYILAGVKPKNE